MGVQQNKISYLEEFSRAASEAHWGLFSVQDERSMEEISYNRSERETLAIGANMPLPPMYRGSTKKEKRKVMDIYMAYDRCVRVLNASTGSRVFLMPVGACIDHKVMKRILLIRIAEVGGGHHGRGLAILLPLRTDFREGRLRKAG